MAEREPWEHICFSLSECELWSAPKIDFVDKFFFLWKCQQNETKIVIEFYKNAGTCNLEDWI